MWFTALLGIIDAALQIWESKEKTKYIDKRMQLEKDYYAEFNKPHETRSSAVLDNLEFELRVLAQTIASDIRTGAKSA